MSLKYTNEVDIQIVLALLKAHNIKRIVVSPGTTNHTLVLSAQQDSFFEMYSCVDERSAAYMACGIAAESGEPVVLSCTGATASRNYFPALTEAYYRQLPIIAITSTRNICQVGNLVDQQIDRTVQPKDTVKMSVQIPYIKDDEDFWECELKVNKAILECTHHGSGPVHINLPTRYDHGYDCNELPKVRCIKRFEKGDILPELPKNKKIGIYIGAHRMLSEEENSLIDRFCESNNAVVFYEHTSGYKGKYGFLFQIAQKQKDAYFGEYMPNLVIDFGEISCLGRVKGDKLWRINSDGALQDPYRNLEYVFEMDIKTFFSNYLKNENKKTSYFDQCKRYYIDVTNSPVEIPFSNMYAASKLSKLIPENSVMHFGILNSLRSWTFFDLPKSINCYSNTGGYGIDGGVSTLIGASLVHPEKLYFGIFGDLCFFYDMNSLGNRHISTNLRILIINNGIGEEFKLFTNHCYQWGTETNKYVAAEGHFGKKSPELIRHYATDLGFEYLSASNKEEFENVYKRWVTTEITDKPILMEIFTTDEDENQAYYNILHRYVTVKGNARNVVKNLLGEKGTQAIKKIIKR